MKVLSLSLDPKLVDPENVAAVRVKNYGKVVEEYTIIVPTTEQVTTKLADNVTVYGTGGSSKLMQFWRMYQLALPIVRDQKYDVVTSQDTYFLGYLGYRLAKRFKIGLEIQVLGVEKMNWLRRQLTLFVLNRASTIRALSHGIYNRVEREFGIKTDRMHIVPIYVDTSVLGFEPEKLPPEDRAIVERETKAFNEQYGSFCNFVCVNRLVPVKNIPLQINAVAKLKSEFPNLRLHVVGPGEQGELRTLTKKLNVETEVIFHGPKYGVELNPFFTETDCFLLTSFSEGWGMVIVEAATAGLPVIMTEVGCAGEVIKDDESGFVIPVDDEAALLESMRKMLSDSELRARLATGAKESIASLPSFEEVLEMYRASWQRAMENHY